jgi:hypothetical protein
MFSTRRATYCPEISGRKLSILATARQAYKRGTRDVLAETAMQPRAGNEEALHAEQSSDHSSRNCLPLRPSNAKRTNAITQESPNQETFPVSRSHLNCGMRSSSLNAEGSVRETPDRSWPKFIILRFEVEVMHSSGQVFRTFQFAHDKSFVDDHLGGYIRQFTSLPPFRLFSHRLEVVLNSVDPNRDAINQRERLRVFRKHRSEHT